MAPSTSHSKTHPASKRRKIFLKKTLRIRNGGPTGSFLPPIAPADSGSGTEEEDNSALEEEFLNRMTDDTDKTIESVFGKDVEVWKSHGGTVYADINDRVKRKMREQELWRKEEMEKVHVGSKRKAEDNKKSFKRKTDDGKKDKGKKNETPIPHLPTTAAYPPRSPNDNHFHHGSAGIDPLGAHNRPVKPLPKHAAAPSGGIFSGLGRVNMEGNQQSQYIHTGVGKGVDCGLQFSLPLPAYRNGRTGPPIPPSRPFNPLVPNGIVSGSFGSFERTRPGRFDERPYRLVQQKKKDEENVRKTCCELKETKHDEAHEALPARPNRIV